MSDPFESQLSDAKGANLGHLLLRSARLLNEQGVALAREKFGLDGLRPAHLSVMPHLDLHGTRQTELARRMDVTKQAVGPIVDDLERFGMVERVPDPTDGRARIVRFTEHGKAMLVEGLAVFTSVEHTLEATLGVDRINRLKVDLAALLAELESG